MEFIPAGSLRTRHPHGTSIPFTCINGYVTQLALILHAGHEHNSIHQDLKPENVLVDLAGSLLLADSGLARALPAGQVLLTSLNTQAVLSALTYMAPEQFRGRPCRASDQYALAVMAYEWLTGVPPFVGTVAELCHQHLFVPPPSLREKVPDIPEAVVQVLCKALSKEPERRFLDVLDFASALELAGHGIVSPLLSIFPASPAPVLHPEALHLDNLPGALTSLLGREEECVVLMALLVRSQVRLLTIMGTGGVGKTRLALAVARQLREAFADGVCFVSLSALRAPEQVIPTIAQALERQTGSRPVFEILQAYLRERQMLLVLDNFEHVISAAPQLTALLAACPTLKLLVTSRERLRIAGEYEFSVPLLPLPDLTQELDIATLARNPAVALFVERAQATKPDLHLTTTNASLIAQICVQVDGLPLALELAAARITLLSPSALLARLSHRLQMLTRGRRDAPLRQQTLRDTIRWSYDLLSLSERKLFRRLCVFVGGCSLAVCEQLYRELDDDAAGVFEDVSSLLDKSLLLRQGSQEEELRLLLLETIREFGLECLAEDGELELVQQAHVRCYLHWAEQACQGVFGKEQALWLRRFVQEQGNWRAAMQFVLQRQDREAALYLGGWLGPIWFLWGSANQYVYMVEGRHFLQQALALGEETATWPYARSLYMYGGILGTLRESELSVVSCQRALALFWQMDDLQAVIQGQWMLFYAWFAQSDFREARKAAEKALMHSLEHPEVCIEWGTAWTQGYSSFLAGYIAVWDGRYEEARALLLECSALVTRAGDYIVLMWAHLLRSEAAVFEGKDEEASILLAQGVVWYRERRVTVLVAEATLLQGLVAWHVDDMDEAGVLLSESLRLSEEAGDERRIAWTENWLARVALACHQLGDARHLLSNALGWAMRKYDRAMVVWGLEGLGMVVSVQDEPAWAARLWGTAEVLREVLGFPRAPHEQPVYTRHCEAVRAVLGEASAQACWEEGRRMTPQQVLLEPEGKALFLSNSAAAKAIPASAAALGLTRRELDVLRLLAQGMTNAQTAEQLMLSTVTVNSYLRSIYTKLGVSSRTQAMRFAYEHHLL